MAEVAEEEEEEEEVARQKLKLWNRITRRISHTATRPPWQISHSSFEKKQKKTINQSINQREPTSRSAETAAIGRLVAESAQSLAGHRRILFIRFSFVFVFFLLAGTVRGGARGRGQGAGPLETRSGKRVI